MAFFCLNLSFAQIEASYVLLLRDYLGFGAAKTGWLFAYIGVCIILVQSVLINVAVRRFGEVGTVVAGAGLFLIGQGLTVLISLGFMAGANYPLVQIVTMTTAVCFGFASKSCALSRPVMRREKRPWVGRLERFRGLLRLDRLVALF